MSGLSIILRGIRSPRASIRFETLRRLALGSCLYQRGLPGPSSYRNPSQVGVWRWGWERGQFYGSIVKYLDLRGYCGGTAREIGSWEILSITSEEGAAQITKDLSKRLWPASSALPLFHHLWLTPSLDHSQNQPDRFPISLLDGGAALGVPRTTCLRTAGKKTLRPNCEPQTLKATRGSVLDRAGLADTDATRWLYETQRRPTNLHSPRPP